MAASEERRAGERERQKFQLANAASGELTKVSGGRPAARRKHQAALHPQTPDEPASYAVKCNLYLFNECQFLIFFFFFF